MKFLEPTRKPNVIYTDNSLEFGKSCEELSWNHCTSTPRRSETNGIAERAVRRVKQGTSAVLLQSGLDENWWADSMECETYLRNIQDLLSGGKRHPMKGGSEHDNEWWADSMECYCHLRHIQDKLSDGKTPYERRFGMPFNEPVIPLGAMVECHPISAKDLSRLHQFGSKVLPGIVLGYALYTGGIWKRRRYGRGH